MSPFSTYYDLTGPPSEAAAIRGPEAQASVSSCSNPTTLSVVKSTIAAGNVVLQGPHHVSPGPQHQLRMQMKVPGTAMK